MNLITLLEMAASGHGDRIAVQNGGSDNRIGPTPSRVDAAPRKWPARIGMSSDRARNGATSIGYIERR